MPETCHRILFVRPWLIVPTFLPLRVQYESEKLQLGFGMHSLALPSGPHVPISSSCWLWFVTICHIASDIQILSCRVPTPFAKAWFGPWIPWTILDSLAQSPAITLWPCAKVHVQLPLGSWNYRKGREWYGMAALPLDGLGLSSNVTLEKTHRDQNARFCQYDTSSESNHCGFIMLLYFIMLYITNCISSSYLFMFIRLFLSYCISSQCIQLIFPLCFEFL